MIIFAYISRISIGKIFFGGAIPGFITASLYIIYITIRCYLQPEFFYRLKDLVFPCYRLSKKSFHDFNKRLLFKLIQFSVGSRRIEFNEFFPLQSAAETVQQYRV